MLFDTVSAPKKGGKRDENVENVGKSYTVEEILHPTLHRKLPDFIGIFHIGCRKCRIFLQNFGSASIWVIDMFLHVLAWLINLSDNQHIN